MINRNFKLNWSKIINFNSKFEILDQPSKIMEIVRIPLTPINIDAHLLYYLFELLYPKFVNDQQNILDIIITDDNREILSLYLYETRKAGIHESFVKLSRNIVIFQEDDLENIEGFFNKIQLSVVKATGVRISTMRVLKQKAIDLINEHSVSLENLSTYNFITSLMGLIQELYDNNLFYIYPIPNFHNFIKESIALLNGIKLSGIFEFLYDILPKFSISFLFNSDKQPFILRTQKDQPSTKNSRFYIEPLTLERLGIDIKNLNTQDILNLIKKKSKSDKVYSLNQKDIISLLLDIFELDFPLALDSLQLIFQKILYGIRNFENKWYMVPRPQVYNSLFRFFVRLFRFNLNLKKLSHWTIPQLLFNSIKTNFGLNSKILIIITSIDKKNFNKVEYVKNAFKFALLFEIENRTIAKIIPINKSELFSEHKINSLDVIRANVSDKYGYVSAVMNIDKFFLTEIMGNFLLELSKFNPFSNFKTLKLFNKEYYFNMYPEIPPFKFIKENGMGTFFKLVLPVFIDKHEF